MILNQMHSTENKFHMFPQASQQSGAHKDCMVVCDWGEELGK